jgi:mutator protein MutT
VVAAVIEDGDRLLVTRRPAGSHLEGFWEFPGGKVAPGEAYAESLAREIHEELGCACEVGDEVFSTEHAYPGRVVRLHFLQCRLVGEPRAMLGQEMRWVTRGELSALRFPPADEGLVALLTRV